MCVSTHGQLRNAHIGTRKVENWVLFDPSKAQLDSPEKRASRWRPFYRSMAVIQTLGWISEQGIELDLEAAGICVSLLCLIHTCLNPPVDLK
jgi:hypothetical protein